MKLTPQEDIFTAIPSKSTLQTAFVDHNVWHCDCKARGKVLIYIFHDILKRTSIEGVVFPN